MKLAHIPAAKKSTLSRTGSLCAVEGTGLLVRRSTISSSSLNSPKQARLTLVEDFINGVVTAPSTAIFFRFERKSFRFWRWRVVGVEFSRGEVTRISALTITGGHSS